MRVLRFDRDGGELSLIPETTEDLWHMERVLSSGDFVSGSSFRRFKTQEEGESGEKKPVKIELCAEKIEFNKNANKLRISGKIRSGSPEEYVQIGSYHTLDIELGKPVKIKKEWKDYQLSRIKEAQKESRRPRVGIAVLDDESALFASLKGYGVEFGAELSSHLSRKDEKREEKLRAFFGEIAKLMENSNLNKFIVAGPGFTKDNFKKFLHDKRSELLSKITFDSCSSAERSGIYELLKRGTLSKILGEERLERELALIEKFLLEISKDSGLAVYGKDEIKNAIACRALSELFILDELLRGSKEAEALLEQAEKLKLKPIIFSAEGEAGRQLKGFGGIAGILRFKYNV